MLVKKSYWQKVSDFFPNTLSVWIFVVYIVSWVGQGIFIALTRTDEQDYKYNAATAILFSETIKLIVSYFCYIRNHSLSSLWLGIKNNMKILCLYLVPSFLYCCYNNLVFVNLSHYDPTSYNILMQLRIVLTGVCFQVVFNKKLKLIQWLSLILLTFACAIQQLDFGQIQSFFFFTEQNQENPFFSVYFVLIIIQAFCSSMAGVYNECLLKDTGATVNIFIQNIFMYIDSILWNLLFLLYQGNLFTLFTSSSLGPIFQPLVLVIIFNSSFIGITTSLFLKHFNSIIKLFVSASELVLTAFMCWIVLGLQIKINTFLSIPLICYCLYTYFRYSEPEKVKEVEEPLLEDV